VLTMSFSTCFVHPARIGSRGRTRRQNEWYPGGRQVAILVSRDAYRPSLVGGITVYEIAEELA
jgi:hypothetical protein